MSKPKAVRVRDNDSGRAPTKLTSSQAGELASVQPGTWRRYTTPNTSRGGKLHGPPPDGHSDPCGCPWWWKSTVEHWIADRPRTPKDRGLETA